MSEKIINMNQKKQNDDVLSQFDVVNNKNTAEIFQNLKARVKKGEIEEKAIPTLLYHQYKRQGKIEVISTKPCETQRDLSLAYTPGVAIPCLEIEKNPDDAYKYTARGNLVAVITNGTAVLGLGNIGALAGKPVMEGKGILFKKFADVDVFDIELDSKDSEEIIKACKMLAPTFGGINLEDIKAPECFIIEERLKAELDIPVFHDDQHGTAIIGGAALLNAIKLTGRDISKAKVVMNGAGASGLAIASLILKLGVSPENLTICDTNGVIYRGREKGMNPYKEKFARDTKARTLEEAAKGADVLYGLSKKGAFSKELIRDLADNPIIFAMANPDPEITPEEVAQIRTDAIMATGRSDYPNQINNVMCFPFLFRGALDVKATAINEEMKLAAAHAIAELAYEPVPDVVRKAYGGKDFKFGKEYILPTPFDNRLLVNVSVAVAKAAIESGVARCPITDFDDYELHLKSIHNPALAYLKPLIRAAKQKNTRVGFPFAEKSNVLLAAVEFQRMGLGKSILIGDTESINKTAKSINVNLSELQIIDPKTYSMTESYIDEYHQSTWRKGLSRQDAINDITNGHYNRFAAYLIEDRQIDTMVAIAQKNYKTTLDVLIKVLQPCDKDELPRSIFTDTILANRDGITIINNSIDYNFIFEDVFHVLVRNVLSITESARMLELEPRVALIESSNFVPTDTALELLETEIENTRALFPKLKIDGPISFDLAMRASAEATSKYPYCEVLGNANILVFPHPLVANVATSALTMNNNYTKFAEVLHGFYENIQIAMHDADYSEILTLAIFATFQEED